MKVAPHVHASLIRWFPLAQKPAQEDRVREQYGHRYSRDPWMMLEVNQDILKGLVWACRFIRHPDIPRLMPEGEDMEGDGVNKAGNPCRSVRSRRWPPSPPHHETRG